jgi:hypothetical protein
MLTPREEYLLGCVVHFAAKTGSGPVEEPGGFRRGIGQPEAEELCAAARRACLAAGLSPRPRWLPKNLGSLARLRRAYERKGLPVDEGWMAAQEARILAEREAA